jgi:phosphatidylglycerophosphate synthase
MKLHRSGKKADWDAVAPEHRSFLQRMAAKTGGALTPGNSITILGAVFVGIGLYDIWHGHVGRGIVEIAIGRLADLLDGMIAESTQTKSPVGEALDAAFDKIVLFSVLAVFIAKDILPAAPAISILVLQATTAGISLIGKQRKRELHPSQAGKVATAVLWVGLLLYGTAALASQEWLLVLAHGITAGALVGGAVAAAHYARVTFQK